jgi:hypothetical protein
MYEHNAISSLVRRKSSVTNMIMQLDEQEHEYHGGLSLTPFSPGTPLSATSTFMRFGSHNSIYSTTTPPPQTINYNNKSNSIYRSSFKSSPSSASSTTTSTPASAVSYAKKMTVIYDDYEEDEVAQKMPTPSESPPEITTPAGKSKIKSLIRKLKSKRSSISLRVKTN